MLPDDRSKIRGRLRGSTARRSLFVANAALIARGRDVGLPSERHDQFAVAFKQPLGVDDRQPDDLACRVEPQNVARGSLLTVGHAAAGGSQPRWSGAATGREHGFAMRLQLRVLVDDVPRPRDVEHNPAAVRINRFAGSHFAAGAGTLAGANAASKRSSSSGRAFARTCRAALARCDPPDENLSVTSGRTASLWERRAWAAGAVFVVALLAEAAISTGLPINQDDSATKIAHELQDHRHTVLIAAYLSTVYAVAFLIYLAKLHGLLHRVSTPPGTLHSLVLIGGVLLVALHGVSDIGIYGLLGGKIATYAAHNDQGLSYTLYLLTFALDSVGDVFGSVFLIATGVLLLRARLLPRWLAWIAVTGGTFLFVQGFGLGGVIGTYGLVLDLIGFVLFLVFVLVSSVMLLRRQVPARAMNASGSV
jgi:Domain of unknown function (DUF4386)